jgi:hypothetical protein
MSKVLKALQQNGSLEAGLASLRACHHVCDAARILSDAIPHFPAERRQDMGAIVRELDRIETNLKSLEVTES